MPRLITTFAIFSGVLLLFLASFYVLVPRIVDAKAIQDNLIQEIEEILDGEIYFEGFELDFFPGVSAQMRDVSVSSRNMPEVDLKAKTVTANLSFFSVLFRKVEISHLEVTKGELVFDLPERKWIRKMEISNIRLRLSAIRSLAPIQLDLQGDLEGIPDSLWVKGVLTIPRLSGWDWDEMAFRGTIGLQDITFEPLKDSLFNKRVFVIEEGSLNGEIEIQKLPDDSWLNLKGKLQAKDLIYQVRQGSGLISSTPIQVETDLDLRWAKTGEELDLRQLVFTFPIGVVEIRGKQDFMSGELRDMSITAFNVTLESLPQYIIPLRDAIPFNIGFSGQSNLEMSLQGTLDHLSMHGNWDLTPTLLTYGGYFSKPKEMPLGVVFDFLLQDAKTLSGDFSVRIQETTIKGALTDVSFHTGDGQLNIISNKFPLSHWTELSPLFRSYVMRGEMKVFANFNGNFHRPHEMQKMFNITLEDGYLESASGKTIRSANVVLDYGPLAFDIKQANFEVNESPIEAQLQVVNLGNKPTATAKIRSRHFRPQDLLEAMTHFGEDWFSEKSITQLRQLSKGIEKSIWAKEKLEDFSFEGSYAENQWIIDEISFQLHDGFIKIVGAVDLADEATLTDMDLEVNRLSLARILDDKGREILEGSLFLRMQMAQDYPVSMGDKWTESFKGDGIFSVTNGEFYSFDILEAISKVDELSNLKSLTTGSTSFDDLRSRFIFEDGKINIGKLMLVSRDLWIEADGEMSWDGILNFRLDTYLSTALASQVLGPSIGISEIDQDKKLGPIPLLLAGPLANPEMKADPLLLPTLREDLQRKRTHKIFRSFLPEDLFFEREANS